MLCSLVNKRQDGTVLNLTRPTVKISLTLVKDSSLNLRRDLLEEKETQIKLSLRSKIERCIAEGPQTIFGEASSPRQLTFTFSVVSDDGNLPSALVAGSSDMLTQLTAGRSATMWSCLVLMHSGPPPAEDAGS